MAVDRKRISVEGLVQGVGMRPYVYHLAHELALSGFVCNTQSGVLIEVEGDSGALEEFDTRLLRFFSDGCQENRISRMSVPLRMESTFTISQSITPSKITTPFPRDFAVCRKCLDELGFQSNRRFRFPFISCAECGPRYSICIRLPFDRVNTSLEKFPLCSECLFEYSDPENRRFHAQTIGCFECGPKLWICTADGIERAFGEDAISEAISAISEGSIVAVKGIGGIHLMCDARNHTAIGNLRLRKVRPRKPFAVMYPTIDLVRNDCDVSEREVALLCSPQAPVVLLRRKTGCVLPESLAPQNAYLGVMLPYTPLHYLIMQGLGAPVVATSGNISGEPICAEEIEALSRLGSIADLFLFHDRRIVNRCDDSVVQVILDSCFPIRVARGYAPFIIPAGADNQTAVLGMGAYLKNTIALAHDGRITVSPHIGDIGSLESKVVQEQHIESVCSIYGVDNLVIVKDLHPDLSSCSFREVLHPQVAIQHHYAHALSCLVDNDLEAPCLAVTWDGTGYGTDGAIWGGEGLIILEHSFERRFSLYPFLLLGGEFAVRDPKRVALGLLYEASGSESFSHPLWNYFGDAGIMQAALMKKVNCPKCTSIGRLFDGIAALLGVSYENTFEGEAAMGLQYTADHLIGSEAYEFSIGDDTVIDWRGMISQILSDIDSGFSNGYIASRFHSTLVNIIVAMARIAGFRNVLLTGGCFQNSLLLTASVEALREHGFNPFWHRRMPTGDGNIAIGQVVAGLNLISEGVIPPRTA